MPPQMRSTGSAARVATPPLGGEIDFAAEASGWAPMVAAGKPRLLAVFTGTPA